MIFRGLAVMILCIPLIAGVHAQPVTEPAETVIAESAEPSSPEELLQVFIDSIKDLEIERTALNQQLKRAPDAAAAQQLQAQLALLDQRLNDLRNSFEELATGGLSIETLTRKPEDVPFNWQQELEEVVRPLLDELKRLTERPRLMERLKSERTVYENRLQIASAAIAELEKTRTQAKTPSVNQALKVLLGQWQDQRENAESRLQRINAQLERLSAPVEAQGKGLAATLQEFAKGRGLNLALALSGFALVYLALAGSGRLIGGWVNRSRELRTRQMARAIALIFRTLTLILALFTAILVLYVRGDWLLLGLIILLLIGLVWGLQKSLPRYVKELRLLLNMGSVREGERVIYQGVPWQVASLNLETRLYNPALRGGGLHLPIDQLADLQSRTYAPEEPWFPSQEGDFVILDGDIYAKVLLQTPEVVQLQIMGSTTTLSVADYLGKQPRNLSRDGFALPIVFGLDYQHQGEILPNIVPTLRAYLEEQLAQQPFHPSLTALLVEFNEAASSSLNLLIVAAFTGAGAGDYWSIRRFLQRTALNACNQYGWTIPFEQLTVHLPPAQP